MQYFTLADSWRFPLKQNCFLLVFQEWIVEAPKAETSVFLPFCGLLRPGSPFIEKSHNEENFALVTCLSSLYVTCLELPGMCAKGLRTGVWTDKPMWPPLPRRKNTEIHTVVSVHFW